MKAGKSKQTATLKDIALKTGYSINTVSRALRDKDDIAPATREKIKQAAREMGHINNMIASSLRLGYTNTIAVILGDVSNPHFAIMMKEIEERARECGYFSFLINTDEDEELELKAIQSALNKNVDGIIICPTQRCEENIRYLKATGVPFVLIGRRFENIPADYVICNDELGGYQATKYLLDHGHHDILMMHGPSYISSAKERLAGYLKAYEEAGLQVDDRLICEVPVTANGCRQVLDRVLEQEIPFSAVFAFSDLLAWDAWSYLKQRGYRIPEDYSVIGFDNIQSRLTLPFRLSSISSYKGRMSVSAVDLLVSLIQEDRTDSQPREVVIDTKLAEGDTVGSCAAVLV